LLFNAGALRRVPKKLGSADQFSAAIDHDINVPQGYA
jgi:hypothetical protein